MQESKDQARGKENNPDKTIREKIDKFWTNLDINNPFAVFGVTSEGLEREGETFLNAVYKAKIRNYHPDSNNTKDENLIKELT
ncbi:MAG TPA: hypothetical protein PKX78_00960, partial [Candidatus Woesebacteria bacterium]|nr:hypothetical protein [Candidatus Woesebacteria bacterium]